MLHYDDVLKARELCECLAAPARVEILKQVLSHRADSLDSLAKTLHLSNGAITQHVKKLCDAGLIRLEEFPGRRGIAKRCVPAADRIIIDLATDMEQENECLFDLPIGSFTSAAVKPYCGIASPDGWIGERDDPRYFTYPDRARAAMIYFNSGKLTWSLPSPARKGKPRAVSLAFELSSKPYGHGRSRDSEIDFFMNDIRLGTHTVDGEFTDRKGLFTPDGFDDMCQYGKYKTVRIDADGTYLDGIRIGGHTIDDFTACATFSIHTENGIAIFGKGYGDYDCGLRYRVEFD